MESTHFPDLNPCPNCRVYNALEKEPAMNYYALFYDYAEDYLARREEFRSEHLRLAQAAHASGELLLGGALDNPLDTGLLVFRATDAEVVEAFVRSDPYVTQGLVMRWTIRPWNVVIGAASGPVMV
jgi:uncharacterized protein